MSIRTKHETKTTFIGTLRLATLAGLITAFGAGAQAAPAPASVYAYVAAQNGNTVAVIDTSSNTVTATIPVGLTPTSVALTPDRASLYVANGSSNSVSVVSTATNTVTATIPVGNIPYGIAITPDGAFAYVANLRSHNVSVIDTATHTVVTTVAVGLNPMGVAITPDQAFVYVTNQSSDSVSVIDTATNTVVTTVAAGRFPGPVAASPDGAFVYVGIFFSPGVGGVSVVDRSNNTVIKQVVTGNQPSGIAFSADGTSAYVANFVGSSVSAIDTATIEVVATISSSEARTPAGVAITPNGAFAYAANFNSNNVSVIDTATNTITALIPGVSGPGSIAITPNRSPTASCHDVTVAAGASCTASASINNGSSDPDGDALSYGQTPAGLYSLGTTGALLSVTDSYGASNSCIARVTVVDRTAPTITCPANLTVKGNIPNSPYANVTPGSPTVIDNCASSTTVGLRSDGKPLDAPYPFGTTTIIQTATDAGGNQASCQQTITVEPNTPTDKEQCKNGGWQNFTNPTFKNQGDCVSFVNH